MMDGTLQCYCSTVVTLAIKTFILEEGDKAIMSNINNEFHLSANHKRLNYLEEFVSRTLVVLV